MTEPAWNRQTSRSFVGAAPAIAPVAPAGRTTRIPSYSRFVRMMKMVLPSIAAILLALVVVWPQINVSGERIAAAAPDVSPTDVKRLRMENARYYGTDENNQPFYVNAATAQETAPGSRVVTLAAPQADMALEDGGWVAVAAESGLYDEPNRQLRLNGHVEVFHDGGYQLATRDMHVDLPAGSATTNRPVSAHGEFGWIESEGLRLEERGEVVTFTGKAILKLYPKGAGS